MHSFAQGAWDMSTFKDWIEYGVQAAQREWIEALPVELPPARLQAAFQIFDENRDNFVDSWVSLSQSSFCSLYLRLHAIALAGHSAPYCSQNLQPWLGDS